MAAPANSVESEMATEYYYEQCRVFPDFHPSPPRLPFPPSPPQLPFSPSLPQNQEHDDILVHPDASTVTPPYVAGGSDPAFLTICQEVIPDFRPLPPWPSPSPFSPSLPQYQEHDNYIRLLQSYKYPEQKHEEFWRPYSLSPPSLPQYQEHDNILVHPDASTVTPIRKRERERKQRSRKNKEHDDDIPFGPSPPQLPFSPLLPQIQEHDYDNILALSPPEFYSLSPPQNQEHNDDDIRRLPPLPFSPSLPQNQEHDDDYIRLLQSYKYPEQEHNDNDIRRLPPLPFSPSLPQYQEHDNILVHPDASTVTPIRKRKRERKQRSRKNNGRTSSGVGSDDKFNQGVDESVDGRTIGKLFVSNRELALGSNGTIVLEGTYEGHPVAVKRLFKAYRDAASKEHRNLRESDSHPNIVRLYGKESDRDFEYLALERCTGSLNDLIQMQFLDAPTTNGDQATEVNIQYKVHLQSMKGTLPEVKLWEDNGYPSPTLWKLMRDMVSGLVHLHELGMIHRDLKPQNVLIVKEGSVCAKLSDMGISKRLVGDKSSLGNHATGCGTSGWQAPELLHPHGRQTRAIDVFSLGCVLFYCISGGKHPFGDPLVRDVNIDSGKVKLFLVKHIPEAINLLDHLLDRKAELRPKASEVLIHPMFWDSDKRLLFLHDASDRVEREGRGSAILQELERRAPRVLGTKRASKRNKKMVLLEWDKKIDPSLLNRIDNPRKYDYESVRDLLRFIRNKKSHFHDLRHEIQEILRPYPKGFDGYFRKRFPKLLMEVYKVLHKYCREEEWCNKYFKGSVDCVV